MPSKPRTQVNTRKAGKTVTHTFRLPAKIIDALSQEAERQGVTVNVVGNQILEEWTEWGRFIKRFPHLVLSRVTFAGMLETISRENVEKLARESAMWAPRTLLHLMGREPTNSDILDYFIKKAASKYGGLFDYDSHVSPEGEYYLIRHDLGEKGTVFIKSHLETLLSTYLGLTIEFRVTPEYIRFLVPAAILRQKAPTLV